MDFIEPQNSVPRNGAPRIYRLPSDLINQIAAGEVVERPASLIKELVENSLDAGATRIEVHLVEGGLSEITIIDNGCGITEEDLPLAVERHTTSKLKTLKDLESISTFGFRGEALSSIASVSDFTIRSRTGQQERGMSLHVPFGEKEEMKPVGCPPGTQISVKGLFSRIPARFKFLRAQATELSHCHRTFKELALGNPEVAFFLHHNGRLLAKYTAPDRLGRIKETLKQDWEPLRFQDSIDEMKFEAFLSPLDWTQERGEIVLFINQRPVKNRLLLSSIKNSFIEVAGPNHEPSGVFYLDIRGDWVDVNVHPQKLEVRFFRQERIYSWLLSSLKKQLAHLKTPVAVLPPMSQTTAHSPVATESGFGFIKSLGSKFWLFENPDGLWVVNPKALWQRSLFLRFSNHHAEPTTTSVALPVPEVVTLPYHLFPVMKQHLALFQSFGFELELFGDKDVAIKTLPPFLANSTMSSLLGSFLSELMKISSQLSPEDFNLEAIKRFVGQIPTPSYEVLETDKALWASLREMNESWTCPMGKPVLFKLSWNQLEQHFNSI